MTEKESAHANFADFAGIDESEPMSHNEAVGVDSNATPIQEIVSLDAKRPLEYAENNLFCVCGTERTK